MKTAVFWYRIMDLMANQKTIACSFLGAVKYAEGLALQREIHEKVRKDDYVSDGALLLLEHYPVITNGRFGKDDNFVLPVKELEKRGIEVFRTERGGDVTFHGPGQLVAYPVIDLRAFNLGAKAYVRALEETLIRVLDEFGISSGRKKGYPGVWTEKGKIASIGVAVKNGVTMHGCALNVNTDLDYFSLIVPCGISDAQVTSIKGLTAKEYEVEDVSELFVRKIGEVLNTSPAGEIIMKSV